jgi:hypothetical protein
MKKRMRIYAIIGGCIIFIFIVALDSVPPFQIAAMVVTSIVWTWLSIDWILE